MTAREAARSLQRYLSARERAASLTPSYTTRWDTTPSWVPPVKRSIIGVAMVPRTRRWSARPARHSRGPPPCPGPRPELRGAV